MIPKNTTIADMFTYTSTQALYKTNQVTVHLFLAHDRIVLSEVSADYFQQANKLLYYRVG